MTIDPKTFIPYAVRFDGRAGDLNVPVTTSDRTPEASDPEYRVAIPAGSTTLVLTGTFRYGVSLWWASSGIPSEGATATEREIGKIEYTGLVPQSLTITIGSAYKTEVWLKLGGTMTSAERGHGYSASLAVYPMPTLAGVRA